MRLLRSIVLSLLAGIALTMTAQSTTGDAPEWYLNEVVGDVFVGQNDFEYYYQPTAAEVRGHLDKGEAVYFLNSPAGLNSKKVRDLIDRLMASYDDIRAVSDWHMTSGTYWKEFRHERNRFRFSVKRKALDDGTYYVSVTENADYYKSLGKGKNQNKQTVSKDKQGKATTSSTRRGRRKVVDPEATEAVADDAVAENLITTLDDETDDSQDVKPVLTEKQRRQQARQRQEEEKMAERARQRRAQEKRREEAKAQKEAEKQLKAEQKQKKEEEKRLKEEEKRREREQARRLREQERQEKEAARKQAAAPKPVESRYHYNDVALWLSEKYDFMQTAASEGSCTMYSTAVKDVEMAKLAIKNALKGSNARMAVPWRVNSDTQAIETGYAVDDHVLVFAIGTRDDGTPLVTITEVTNDQFELFKQGLTP